MIDRVLVVGFGSIGKRHLRLARELLPASDIRVLRRKLSDEIPEYANGCFSSLSDALAFSPNIAVIATPAPFHIATAQALADTGAHLLIEKPLSASFHGVNRLLDTCKEKRVVLMVGYNLRFVPSLQRFRTFVFEGVIGRVLSLRCEIGQYLPSWRPDSDYRQGVTAKRELGGGALLELSHEIDYLRWVFGDVEWVISSLSRQSGLDIDVEDSANIIIGFCSKEEEGRKLIGTLNLDLIRHDSTRTCLAIGENGSLRWDGLTGQVMLYREGEKVWRELFSFQHHRDDSYRAEWRHFVHCVANATSPLISGEDGLRVIEIIEAARRSSELSRRVDVDKCDEPNGVNS